MKAVHLMASVGLLALVSAAAYLAIGHLITRHQAVKSSVGQQYFTLSNQDFKVAINVEGTVLPGAVQSVLAPFDGSVIKLSGKPDSQVHSGDVLATLNLAEVEQRVRDAETAALRNNQTLRDLRNWTNSLDVMRSRRSLQMAQTEMSALQQKLQSSKHLLDRGIIPRQEYQDMLLQFDNQQSVASASKQELEDILKKGGPDQVHIAELESQSAQARLQQARLQLSQSSVIAPVSGLILRDFQPNASASPDNSIAPGTHVSVGQLLFRIADMSTLAVSASVDEIDISRIRVGQIVNLGGTSLGSAVVTGRVISVGLQANSAEGSNRGVKYTVTATLDHVPEMITGDIRLGMHMNLEILVHENRSALVVPADAIMGDASNPTVWLVDPKTGARQARSVKVGEANAHGVEIMDGLSDGDVIGVRM